MRVASAPPVLFYHMLGETVTVYFLFGEMGVGKNYIGEKLASLMGCKFYDGDDALPVDLQEKIRLDKTLTVGDVDRFVTENLLRKIMCEYEEDDIVVAQALYFRHHRQFLTRNLDSVVWLWIRPPSFFTHMWRLFKRERGLRWIVTALLSKPYFQKPRGEALPVISTTNLDVHKLYEQVM